MNCLIQLAGFPKGAAKLEIEIRSRRLVSRDRHFQARNASIKIGFLNNLGQREIQCSVPIVWKRRWIIWYYLTAIAFHRLSDLIEWGKKVLVRFKPLYIVIR